MNIVVYISVISLSNAGKYYDSSNLFYCTGETLKNCKRVEIAFFNCALFLVKTMACRQ